MIEKLICNKSDIIDIADSIRSKNGTTEEMTFDEIVNRCKYAILNGDIDTSDADAIEEDIKYGKIAYAKGKKLIGTNTGAKLTSIDIAENGTYTSTDYNIDGFSTVNVAVRPILEELTVTENNKEYTPSGDGFSKVIVNVPTEGASGGTGFVLIKTTEYTPSANSLSITFDDIPEEPTMFVLQSSSNITLSSTRNIVSIANDGESICGKCGYTSGSTYNKQGYVNYSNTAYTWAYVDGSLTITSDSETSGGYFASGIVYTLFYVIGSEPNIEGIIPEGTLNIVQNGTYDVTNYVSANVNVSGNISADGLPDTIVAGDTPIIGSWVNMSISDTTDTNTGAQITIPKNGTYRFRIFAWSSSSYSTGSNGNATVSIYKNGTSAESQAINTTVTNGPPIIDMVCDAGDVIELYACAYKQSYITLSVNTYGFVACIAM